MTSPSRALSLAAAELTEAIRWYESKHAGLGGDFLDEVARAIEHVALNPEAGSPMSPDQKTRRILLSRFPYQVVYRTRLTELVIVAVAHLKRRPGYWKNRL